jgi:Tfp pilus assembly pilus retraction ATPase PilT
LVSTKSRRVRNTHGAGFPAAWWAELCLLTYFAQDLSIREGKLHQIPSIMQTGQRLGMQTIDMAFGDLLKRGLIDREVMPPNPMGGIAAA